MKSIKVKHTKPVTSKVNSQKRIVWISSKNHKFLRQRAFDSDGDETITSLIDKAVRSFYKLDRI